jgi:ketosteroid isomerase-like protein
MVPQKPEDWPQVCGQHLNGGDLDAVMELYEPEAQCVARSGETLVGRDAIRPVLGNMIDAQMQRSLRV